MKLVMSVVHSEDAGRLLSVLTSAGYGATTISTTGGVLRKGNSTILVGIKDEQVPHVLQLIQENCCTRRELVNPLPLAMEPGETYLPAPVDVQVGGAVVWVLDVARFERF